MFNHLPRAPARTTMLARQPGSISSETKLRAVGPRRTSWTSSAEEAGFRHIETVWFDAPAANGAVIGRKP